MTLWDPSVLSSGPHLSKPGARQGQGAAKLLDVTLCTVRFSLSLAFAVAAAQPVPPDSALNGVRLDEWLREKDDAHIRWSLQVRPPYLTERQHLETQVIGIIDGDEFRQNPDLDHMVFLFQFRDAGGHVFRGFDPIRRPRDADSASVKELRVFERACIAPGDYDIAGALYDPVSKNHSVRRIHYRAEGIAHDPFPGIWSAAPSVAINRTECDGMNPVIPLRTKGAVRFDLVANQPIDLPDKITPRLWLLSELAAQNGSTAVTVLNLPKRIVRTQSLAGTLNEKKLWAGFPRIQRLIIDAPLLEMDKAIGEFFVAQIGNLRNARVGEGKHVVVILSDPVKLAKGEDPRPIDVQASPQLFVFYIRCDHMTPSASFPPPSFPSTIPAATSFPKPPVMRSWTPLSRFLSNADSLETTLKPLHPKVFDVTTPIEFRHALAEIVREISDQ